MNIKDISVKETDHFVFVRQICDRYED